MLLMLAQADGHPPLKPYAEQHPNGHIDIGTQAIGQRPELDTLIGHCLMAWAPIEAERQLLHIGEGEKVCRRCRQPFYGRGLLYCEDCRQLRIKETADCRAHEMGEPLRGEQ
jgi:hypothetical protein